MKRLLKIKFYVYINNNFNNNRIYCQIESGRWTWQHGNIISKFRSENDRLLESTSQSSVGTTYNRLVSSYTKNKSHSRNKEVSKYAKFRSQPRRKKMQSVRDVFDTHPKTQHRITTRYILN